MKSVNIPINTPTIYIKNNILKFSFLLSFVLNRISNPNPLPVSKPANNVPVEIIFCRYNSVIKTLLAQLGINPIKLDIKYTNILLFNNVLANVSVPINSIITFN